MKRLIAVCLLALILLNSVSAITGSIGNARMILREVDGKDIKVGDVIEKYVLVKNINDVAVDIELFASGDLADDITIISDKFSLVSGEDRKAYFQIEVTKAGTTESNINVKFTPQDGGNGVGLTSTIIIVAVENSFWSNLLGGDGDADSGNNTDVITGSAVSSSSKKLSPGLILVLMMGFFLVLLLVLLMLMIKKKKRVQGIKPKRSVKRNV